MNKTVFFQKKDIRTIGINSADIGRILKDYVKKQGWCITQEKETEGSLQLKTNNPRASILRLFANNAPQIADWQLITDGQKTRIEMFFSLTPSSMFWFYYLFILFFLTWNYHAFYFYGHASDMFAFLKVIITTAFCLFFFSCIDDRRRYINFREGFYSSVKEIYGIRETVIQEGNTFPENNRFFIFILLFTLPMIIRGCGLQFNLDSAFAVFSVSMVFLLLVSLLTLAFVVMNKPHLGKLVRLILVGLQGGALLSLYLFFPIMHLIMSPYLKELGPAIICVPLALFLVIAVMILIAKNLYDTAEELFANLGHYETTDESSEFLMAFEKSAHSRIVSSAIILIWLIFSFSYLGGVYISLSCFEFSFFQRNYIFFTPFSKTLADSLMLGMFSIPLIGFWSLFIQRKVREIHRIAELRRASDIPESIARKVKEICAFAGTGIPKIVISDENSIGGNAKYVFPFGMTLRLTRRTIEELNSNEIDALLAHEIYHIKKHSGIFSILDFLSQWTLFGCGFLTLIQNSKELEYEADGFSLTWLQSKGVSRGVLTGLLDKIAVANSIGGKAYSNGALNFIETRIKSGEKADFKTILKFIEQLFLGDIIVSYIHPTASERIKRIERHSNER